VVVPGVPHHVTQRGNRRQQTFFRESDYIVYRDLLAQFCDSCGVEILAYCLMPNHVHLVAVPPRPDSLRRALGETHRRYSSQVNRRQGWTGYLWQGRFRSCPMDERHTVAAVRYVERNPVRAGLAREPWEWPWSSARAHVDGEGDGLVRVAPLLVHTGNWVEFLRLPEGDLEGLRKHSRSGRPLGDMPFVEKCERITCRDLKPRKVGRPSLGSDPIQRE
jgi:putative transposase